MNGFTYLRAGSLRANLARAGAPERGPGSLVEAWRATLHHYAQKKILALDPGVTTKMNLLAPSALILGLSVTFSSATLAATITVTFDEADINANDTLTAQYQPLGLIFSSGGTLAKVKSPSSFGQPFAADGNVLHFDEKPVHVWLSIISSITGGPASAISFDFRRPASAGTINIALLDAHSNLVHDFQNILWTGPDWQVFDYDGSFGNFSSVLFYASDKFVIDNLSVTTVPLPASVLLLAAALPLVRRKRECSLT